MKLSTIIATIILSLFILMLLSCGNPTSDEVPNTVTDIDGNVYNTVQIGNQVWTVENLRTTKYNDGAPIQHVTDTNEWANLNNGAYCYYGNTTDTNNITKFGALYNWHAVNTGKLAPAGWHVPDSIDWDILQNYLIANGYNWDGTTTGNKIGKSLAAQKDWMSSSTPGHIGCDLTTNNSSGFSALPGGYRNGGGYFEYFLGIGVWWEATQMDVSNAYACILFYQFEELDRDPDSKRCGVSVRLVKD